MFLHCWKSRAWEGGPSRVGQLPAARGQGSCFFVIRRSLSSSSSGISSRRKSDCCPGYGCNLVDRPRWLWRCLQTRCLGISLWRRAPPHDVICAFPSRRKPGLPSLSLWFAAPAVALVAVSYPWVFGSKGFACGVVSCVPPSRLWPLCLLLACLAPCGC